jgi:hypothetical protein
MIACGGGYPYLEPLDIILELLNNILVKLKKK